jgi:hypothetical protein
MSNQQDSLYLFLNRLGSSADLLVKRHRGDVVDGRCWLRRTRRSSILKEKRFEKFGG